MMRNKSLYGLDIDTIFFSNLLIMQLIKSVEVEPPKANHITICLSLGTF